MKTDRRLMAVIAVCLALLQVAAFAQPPGPATFRSGSPDPRKATGQPFVAGRLIVGLRSESAFAAKSRAQGANPLEQRWGSLVRAARPAGGNSYLVEMRATADIAVAADLILKDADVEYVEPDYIYRATIKPNDEYYNRLHALPRIAAEQAWDVTTGNPNVLIAVVDTGVYAGHPDFGQNIVNGSDFINGDANAADDEGHGTHTAGIIAAIGNNGRGVAGMCWQCKVLAVKALNEQGGGSAVTVASGIRYAADRGARIINLSLGGENDSRLLHEAIRYATGRGVLVVVAAGNEAMEGNPVEYPAAYPEVLAVGATDGNDAHAPFSNYGSYVDIAAPGVDIGSTLWVPDAAEAYGAATGTSEAAPFVAGLAGLIWSVNPALSSEEVRRVLLTTVDDLGAAGRDDYFGAGRVNAYRAVLAAVPPPPAAPPPAPTPPADGILFPETGKTLRGEFRRFWEANGGLPIFGYPITDEQIEQTVEGSFLVQYFERNRFELHPEQATPYNVQLGRLGDTLLRRTGVDWYFLPKGQPRDGCQFFQETGHLLCEPFLGYWRSHSLDLGDRGTSERESLALFGMPLSEPQLETNSSGDTVMIQWFERARFEDHTARLGRPAVLLGLLGKEYRTASP